MSYHRIHSKLHLHQHPILHRHTRDQVTERCQQFHVPSAPLRYVNEVLADPHLHARGFLTDPVTENCTVALPNSPIRYAGSHLRPLSPPP